MQKRKQSKILFSKKFHAEPTAPLPSETKKKDAEGWLRSTLTFFLLFGTFFIAIAFLGKYGILAYHQMEVREQTLIEQIEALKQEEQTLLQEVDALHNNLEYIEALARKELGLVRKNEVIYYLKEAPEESQGESQEDIQQE